MGSDVIYVSGALLLCLAIPALVTAFADRRRPFGAIALGLLGAVLMGGIYASDPARYGPRDMPDAVYRVLGAVLQNI